MKNTITIVFISILFLTPDFTQASDFNTANKTEIQKRKNKGRRNKNGQYRKKKGFMWGIFKGKSQCDCPKH